MYGYNGGCCPTPTPMPYFNSGCCCNNNNSSFAIILVLFILLVIVIGARGIN